MTTLAQLFSQNGTLQWWRPEYLTQGFNNRNELGMDFGLPLSTPVASISAGRVVYSQQMNSNPGSSVGYIVQVQNADGSLFHYQHLRSAAVHVGDYVQAGQVLGYSGGCPANGYGSNGCRYTDQYTSGPHIEVRYTPQYDPGAGAWGQNWVNPGNAFQAYSGQNVSMLNSLPGGNNIAGLLNTGFSGGSLLNVALDPTKLSNGIASGLANGLGGVIQNFTGAATDAGIRAFLLVGGFLAVALGLFMLALGSDKAKQIEGAGAQAGGAAIGGEVGAQAAKAIVPPVGDQKRRAAFVREEAKRAPAALPSPKPAALPAPEQKALPAPSGEPTQAELDAFSRAAEERRKRIQAQAGQVSPGMEKLTGGNSSSEVFGVAREIKPPDTPKASPETSTTRAQQILKRIQAGEDEKQRRRVQDIGRKARRTK